MEYDKDGKPGTVVVELACTVMPTRRLSPEAPTQRASCSIPRSSFAEYDDGDPGTILV
ncbi:MAG: hypothetical protein HOJ90_06785 [Alphaproteobacteria bacterium]|nr:hypothetical protein [Alphaproteobacteria bacterium]